MKTISLTQSLKEVKNNSFVGVTLKTGGKALVVNATKGFHLIFEFGNSNLPDGFDICNIYGGPEISICILLQMYCQGIKKVHIFETHKELFKWLSE